MQSKSKSASRMEVNAYKISSLATCSEPWWRSMGYNSIPTTEIGGNTSNSSFLEQSKDCQSQSDDGMDEDDDNAIKESQITASPHSVDGNYGQDNQNFQHQTSVIPHTSNENLTQPPQVELVGRSIACTSNPYYGGMMAGYGPQPLVPHLLDVHYTRLPLALEMAQEPVYVNAKQYSGILRRRQSRAKAELEKKLITAQKVPPVS
ncbi:Nuclear transcription factor Y subunit A-1 like [Actinidia chinensis var. chinensis]|uniref:Nuclear transcription factor Y subunit n=1 Tax=Actinidia chinensis var. chinensis TaxID=1590841 RepID=A0A2R6PQV6_ACTCC|nr:Nuclear transcription factor Y subunit A-1 like [Actinidia chinensis var. chinensis]